MTIQDMPKIGLGTFGSDSVNASAVAQAVDFAVRNGYRHIDCAAVYGNETEIGAVLAALFREGVVRREDLWITSKVWNDKHGDVAGACRKTLADLRLEYLDLYLVHWPFPNFHPPKCDVSSRCPDAKSYIHEDFLKTWRGMEQLAESGLARHIGTSNMTVPKLKLLLRDAHIKPHCNELELHPYFQQPELFRFLRENGIRTIGYCPLGSPGRPERDRTSEDLADMEDPVIRQIAAARGVHPAAVCLKWQAALGAIPIPFSVNPKNIVANYQAVHTEPLSAAEMEQLSKIDKNCRLIKGQVFLWKDDQTWHDLWDEEGVITPA